MIYPFKRLALLIWLGIFCTLLSACGDTALFTSSWTYANLRQLDAPDLALPPDQDLIAVYTRQVSQEYQIRLDFLDLNTSSNPVILLALDSRPGGSKDTPFAITSNLQWEFLAVVGDSTQPYVLNDLGVRLPGITVQTDLDEKMDTVVVRIPMRNLPGNPSLYSIQVFVLCQGTQAKICDRGEVIRPSGNIPLQTNVAFVFWDVLPASTPRQLLRRWDGAHTGPLGQRHGLLHLLNSAQSAQVPLLLLGFENNEAINGLNELQQTSLIQSLQQEGIIFADGAALIPLSLSEENQVDRGGLTLLAKQTLAQSAGSSHPLILGGSMPNSAWADSFQGKEAFQYIVAHPWIKVVNPQNLQELKPSSSELQLPAWFFKETVWLSYHPSQNQCNLDLNHDGRPAECVLSGEYFFVILNSDTGQPAFILSAAPTGVFQWLNNSSALSSQPNYEPLIAQTESDQAIRLTNQNKATQIEYRLDANSLRVTLEAASRQPWSLWFTPVWYGPAISPTYLLHVAPDSVSWRWNSPFSCKQEVLSSNNFDLLDPHQTGDLLLQPEDPNRAYPENFTIPYGSQGLSFSSAYSFNIILTATCNTALP